MNMPTAAKPGRAGVRTASARASVMPPIAITGSGERAQACASPSSPATGCPAGFPSEGKTVPNSR